MEANSLQSDLKRLFNGKDTREVLKIDFNRRETPLEQMRIFENGFWFLAPFAFEHGPYRTLAVSLSPGMKSLKDAPIVRVFTGFYSKVYADTQAPNLKAMIPMTYLAHMESAKDIKKLKGDLDEAIAQSKPLFDYLGEGNLDFLKTYLSNEENQERFKKTKKNYDSFFCDFWNHYHDKPEQKKAFELFAQLIENKKFLPDFEEEDFGLWNCYVRSALTERAYTLQPKQESQKQNRYKHLWKYAQMPLGLDCDEMPFKKYQIAHGNSKDQMWGVSLEVNSARDHYGYLPDEVKNSPLYEATTLIQSREYSGENHLEAAERFEAENNPEASWNALACAGYWAGIAKRRDIVEASWQHAIGLSERQGWDVLHKVLLDQWNFYDFQKNDRRTKMENAEKFIADFIALEMEMLASTDTSAEAKLHEMTSLKKSWDSRIDFGWKKSESSEKEEIKPRYLYKITQYDNDDYEATWVCYLSEANPKNGLKTLDDCFILAQVEGELKLVARLKTRDEDDYDYDKWKLVSGDSSLSRYFTDTFITQKHFNSPVDSPWAQKDFGDYEQVF